MAMEYTIKKHTKTKHKNGKPQVFCNVPKWAPTKGKYTEMCKPLERWMRSLMSERRLLLDKGSLCLLRQINNDKEMVHLCVKVNRLRCLNLELCDNKIILENNERGTITMEPAVRLIVMKLEAIGGNDNDEINRAFGNNAEDDIWMSIWKRDHSIGKNIPLLNSFIKRLESFHAKRHKINFCSPPMISYNKSLSGLRICLNTVCCEFLLEFVDGTC